MTLGERIRDERKKCGLSQEALAEKVNVSRQTVYNWETDQAIPDLKNLKACANIFNITIEELLSEEESKDIPNNTFVDAINTSGKIIKKHWRKGGYLVIYEGIGASIFGLFTLFMSHAFFSFTASHMLFNKMPYTIGNSPFGTFEYVFYGAGIIVLIIGIILIISGFILVKKDKEINKY